MIKWTLFAGTLLASGSAYAAAPETVASMAMACCDAVMACCEAAMDCCP